MREFLHIGKLTDLLIKTTALWFSKHFVDFSESDISEGDLVDGLVGMKIWIANSSQIFYLCVEPLIVLVAMLLSLIIRIS